MSVPELKRDETSGIWYMHWTEPTEFGKRGRSRRKSTGTTIEAAAKAFLGEWLLLDSTTPADAKAVYTCADLWLRYVTKHVDVKTCGPKSIHYCWQNLQHHFGHLTLAQIDQDVVDGYERKRVSGDIGRKSKPATVRKELISLRTSWMWCVNEKKNPLIQISDLPRFDVPPNGKPRTRWLRREEIDRLMDAARSMRHGPRISRVERFLWLALETAARSMAIRELTWDRVDFETGMIHYAVPDQPKTKKRRASVPISPTLLPILQQAHAERKNNFVVDNQSSIWSSVQLVAIEAGFGACPEQLRTRKLKATGVSPHVLRHTAATHMARRGVPLWNIAGVLGNSEAMVREVYGHHCKAALLEAVSTISGKLDAAPDNDLALLVAIKSGKFRLVENV